MSTNKPPFDPDTLYQRALSSHHMGNFSEAEELYKTLLSFFPNQAEVLTPLGTLLLQQGRHEEGITQLRKSLDIFPNQPEALYNLALELQKLSRPEEALACYDKAIRLNPVDAEMHLNRGNALKDLQRFDESLASYNRAINLKPDFAAAYWNKSITKILTGEFEEGWRLYEWGWKCSERGTVRQFTQPLWLGNQPIAGKTLLIHTEQGLGDAIQFCRYVPMLTALGAHIILECPSSLVTLLSTLHSKITVIEKGKDLPEFDMYCPVMSLPLAFKTTLQSIPASAPYLYIDQDKKTEWCRRLGEKSKPRIGLAWSGSATHKNDRNRSIALSTLEPLLSLPCEFHSLQKEIRPDTQRVLSNLPQIHLHHYELNDFSDTAALAQEMDLVISVDTSVAHLAGALGHPVWILLPHSPDYRWMLKRDDSPWYPTATLFRQPEAGDWSNVIMLIAQRIKTTILGSATP